MSFREQIKGFPFQQMFIICIIRFSEPLAFTSLFPYVYFMIRDFGIAKEEQDISKYSGYLASSFAFCQFLFAVRWGQLSDRVGRKKILLFGLFGTSISLILFGFSRNFYFALAARCLSGTLNGNIAVLRTMIGEIATERRHQAMAFSTLPLLFNFGSVIGPAIGGSKWLTRPGKNPYSHRANETDVDVFDSIMRRTDSTVETIIDSAMSGLRNSQVFRSQADLTNILNNPESITKVTSLNFASSMVVSSDSSTYAASILSVYERFITKYPYALSNIVVAMFLWFSLICGFLFLEETHEYVKYKRDYGLDLGDWLLAKFGFKTKPRPWHIHNTHHEDTFIPEVEPLTEPLTETLTERTPIETDPLLDDNASIQSNAISDDDDAESVRPYLSRSMSRAIVKTYSIDKDQPYRKPDYTGAFTPRVITVIVGNFIISLHSVTYNEFLPVFLAARFQPDKLRFPFHIQGGFGLGVSYIGTLFSSTGIMGMLIVLLIFPLIDRKLGTINGYRLSVSIFPIVYFIVPFSLFTLHDYNPKIPTWVTPLVLYSLTSLKTLASATGMPQVMLLNHRAAAKKHRAYVNSATMSILALARCTGPIVFGYLMSLGDKLAFGGLVWWVMGLMALVGTIQSYWMQDYDEDEEVEGQATN